MSQTEKAKQLPHVPWSRTGDSHSYLYNKKLGSFLPIVKAGRDNKGALKGVKGTLTIQVDVWFLKGIIRKE
jgi:hypothetical protein